MPYRITINDNDFIFLMSNCMEYVSKWFDTYNQEFGNKDRESIIRDLFTEYLEQMHVDETIKNYILGRLKITKCNFVNKNEDQEVYYFFGKNFILQ